MSFIQYVSSPYLSQTLCLLSVLPTVSFLSVSFLHTESVPSLSFIQDVSSFCTPHKTYSFCVLRTVPVQSFIVFYTVHVSSLSSTHDVSFLFTQGVCPLYPSHNMHLNFVFRTGRVPFLSFAQKVSLFFRPLHSTCTLIVFYPVHVCPLPFTHDVSLLSFLPRGSSLCVLYTGRVTSLSFIQYVYLPVFHTRCVSSLFLLQ